MINIAIVFGGFSSEHEVSVKSGKFIFDNLKNNPTWNIYEVCISKNYNTVKYREEFYNLNYDDFTFEKNGEIIKPDLVFNMIHGDPGENGDLALILERNNIPQTASNSIVSKLTFNKYNYIDFVKNLGIPCSDQLLLRNGQIIDFHKIKNSFNLPFIVKPNSGGSSIGVSKINNYDQLEKSIEIAFKEDDTVLIEKYLDGQEVSVGVIQNQKKRKILPITEIISNNDFFDFGAKYLGQSKEITPGNISQKSKDLIHDYINLIYDNIDLKGITRSEFIIVNEIPHILETNTIPGFTEQSIVPQQLEADGQKVKDVIIDLINSNLINS